MLSVAQIIHYSNYRGILDIARQYGETDKLLSNTYELCGEVRAPSSMEQLYKSREWFGWADQMTHFVQKNQNYALEAEKEKG